MLLFLSDFYIKGFKEKPYVDKKEDTSFKYNAQYYNHRFEFLCFYYFSPYC